MKNTFIDPRNFCSCGMTNKVISHMKDKDIHLSTEDKNILDKVKELIKFNSVSTGFTNVTELYSEGNPITLSQAIAYITEESRKQGHIITFLSSSNDKWMVYLFEGNITTDWLNTNYWIMLHPEVDRIYGPWPDLQTAVNTITGTGKGQYGMQLVAGMTVGIINGDKIVEYIINKTPTTASPEAFDKKLMGVEKYGDLQNRPSINGVVLDGKSYDGNDLNLANYDQITNLAEYVEDIDSQVNTLNNKVSSIETIVPNKLDKPTAPTSQLDLGKVLTITNVEENSSNKVTYTYGWQKVESGTTSYDQLINKPQINENELSGGNNDAHDLGIATTDDIESILQIVDDEVIALNNKINEKASLNSNNEFNLINKFKRRTDFENDIHIFRDTTVDKYIAARMAMPNVMPTVKPIMNLECYLRFTDRDNSSLVGQLECTVFGSDPTQVGYEDKVTRICMRSHSYPVNATDAILGIGWKDGSVYTQAPTPSIDSDDTNIATTEWVNDKITTDNPFNCIETYKLYTTKISSSTDIPEKPSSNYSNILSIITNNTIEKFEDPEAGMYDYSEWFYNGIVKGIKPENWQSTEDPNVFSVGEKSYNEGWFWNLDRSKLYMCIVKKVLKYDDSIMYIVEDPILCAE